MMDKGSMMGRVSGGGMVRGGVMRGGVVGFDRLVVADLSFVFDISVVLLVFIDVIVNDLGTAIGQLYSVLSLDLVSITVFSTGMHVGVTVFVVFFDGITEIVVFGFFIVGFRMVGGGVMRSRVDWGGGIRSGSMMGSRVGNMVWSRVDKGGVVCKGDWGVMHKGGVGGCNMGVCVGSKVRSMIGHGGGHSHTSEGQNR